MAAIAGDGLRGDYVDMSQLPTMLTQFNLVTKETQMHQKNMGTQVAALKHEFDQTVRANGAKTRELDKTNEENKKSLTEQNQKLAKLTVQMEKANNMMDSVQESSRMVRMQEVKIIRMEGDVANLQTQIEEVRELRILADTAREHTDDILQRLQMAESQVVDLVKQVGEAEVQANAAHERIDHLKAELDDERDERVRIEDEHKASMDQLRNDLALLVNALGGRAQLHIEAFSSISPPNNSGALDVTDARIKKLTEGQTRMLKDWARVEDLEVRMESTINDLKQSKAHINTLNTTDSELAIKINALDRWKNQIELKIEDVETMSLAAQAAAETAAQATAVAAGSAGVAGAAGAGATSGAAAAAGAASAGALQHASGISGAAPKQVASATRLAAAAATTGGPTAAASVSSVSAAAGPPGAAALAAASPAAGIAGIKGVSKEELSEVRAELGGTLKELQAAITSSEQEIQGLKTKLEELERRPFVLSPHPPPPQSVTPPPLPPIHSDAGPRKQEGGGGSSISTLASEGGGGDACGGCGDEAVGGGSRSGRRGRGSVDESSGPAHSADERQQLQQQKGAKGSAMNIPERPGGGAKVAQQQAAAKKVPSMRALTNEEVIELQGETAMLMYNEIQQLRKEIRHIRSSDRPSMLTGTRNFSPWAMRDPFRKLEVNQEICVFPNGTDRDLEYGWMPAAARNILSDPDVEQFMRDAIYMLHREMSLLRKDVDKFKLEGDPALLAAVRAEDKANAARDQCDAIRLRMQEKDDVWAQQMAHLSETLHLNRHDVLERISKLKEEHVSLSQLQALELELRRVHCDTNSLSQVLRKDTAAQDLAFKSIKRRVKQLEHFTGGESAAEEKEECITNGHSSAATSSLPHASSGSGSSLKHGVQALSKRVDALDAILMNRVKENAAKEIEASFKAKYAYTFDFSKTASSGSVENKAPQGDRIFADRIPETRLFDVQRMQINAGQASGIQRPASARILRPKDQTATAPNAGGRAISSAEQVHEIHSQSAGTVCTRSGHILPPNHHKSHRAQQPLQPQQPFKARAAPKSSATAAHAAHMAAVAEAAAEGIRVVALAAKAERAAVEARIAAQFAAGTAKAVANSGGDGANSRLQASQHAPAEEMEKHTHADNALLLRRQRD